jgi:hypothetical protein
MNHLLLPLSEGTGRKFIDDPATEVVAVGLVLALERRAVEVTVAIKNQRTIRTRAIGPAAEAVKYGLGPSAGWGWG